MAPRHLLPVALLCAACVSGSQLAPDAQTIDLRGEDNDLEARIGATWRGLAERDGVQELRFQFTLENLGPTLFALVPAHFELLDATLTSIGVAGTDELPVAVEAGRSATFDMAFPAPAAARLDLHTVTLRVQLQGGRWNWSPTFERDGRWR